MQADSYVTRVLTDRKGMKATGVEYYDKAGERHEQPADAVVIAAFTVENSRILLNSATEAHSDGLGNSSGTLGRYLMSHPAVNVFGMFKEETRCYYGVTGGQLFSQDGFEKEKSGEIFGSRQWEIGLGTKPNDLLGIAMSRADLFGNDLHKFVERGSRHFGHHGRGLRMPAPMRTTALSLPATRTNSVCAWPVPPSTWMTMRATSGNRRLTWA